MKRASSFVAAATVTLLAFGLLSAPSAQAADQSASATCRVTSTTPLTINVGDRLIISTSDLCRRMVGADGGLGGTGTLTYVQGGITKNYPIGTGGTVGLDVPSTVTYTGTVVGGARVEIRDSGAGGVIEAWDVTVVSTPTPSLVESGPDMAHIQQFARPVTGTCDAAQPEGLDWGGADSGGWDDSWAQWMNKGTGGLVCTRVLTYSNSLGHWVVQ